MPNVGPAEIIVVLALVLIIFGPKRLPELGHSLGKGIREFRGSLSGDGKEEEEPKTLESDTTTTTTATAEPVEKQESSTGS
ncbi:MAG: Sec-independent protein translocase subunit TatA/TatB [Solirubrobacterales bacterium]